MDQLRKVVIIPEIDHILTEYNNAVRISTVALRSDMQESRYTFTHLGYVEWWMIACYM